MTAALAMFLAFVLITLGITYWAARRSRGEAAYFAAGRRITAWQNGLAVAGDYMSAASFLGIAGMIAFNGYDGFMYSVGLAGGLPDGAAHRGRTAPQCREIHHGGFARLPAEGPAGPRGGFPEHADGLHLLYDRADGRRGRAGEVTAPGREL